MSRYANLEAGNARASDPRNAANKAAAVALSGRPSWRRWFSDNAGTGASASSASAASDAAAVERRASVSSRGFDQAAMLQASGAWRDSSRAMAAMAAAMSGSATLAANRGGATRPGADRRAAHGHDLLIEARRLASLGDGARAYELSGRRHDVESDAEGATGDAIKDEVVEHLARTDRNLSVPPLPPGHAADETAP